MFHGWFLGPFWEDLKKLSVHQCNCNQVCSEVILFVCSLLLVVNWAMYVFIYIYVYIYILYIIWYIYIFICMYTSVVGGQVSNVLVLVTFLHVSVFLYVYTCVYLDVIQTFVTGSFVKQRKDLEKNRNSDKQYPWRKTHKLPNISYQWRGTAIAKVSLTWMAFGHHGASMSIRLPIGRRWTLTLWRCIRCGNLDNYYTVSIQAALCFVVGTKTGNLKEIKLQRIFFGDHSCDHGKSFPKLSIAGWKELPEAHVLSMSMISCMCFSQWFISREKPVTDLYIDMRVHKHRCNCHGSERKKRHHP